MRVPLAIFVCAGLVATGLGTEPPSGAPLESAKEELKKLQADQTTKTGPAGRLTDGLPRIQTPVPGAVQLEVPTAEKSAKERKKRVDARKNWLLDGVDKLEKRPGRKDAGRKPTGETELPDGKDGEFDSSDPDDLLQLYTEQKKADEAKAGDRKAIPSRVDPFAPFLQGWMQTSPARGKFFDDFVRKSEPAAGSVDAGPRSIETNQSSSPVDVAGASRSVAAAAQPNPYLEGLDMPSPGGGRPNSGQLDPVAVAPVMTAPRPLTSGMLDLIPASRPAEKKPALLAPSDDKKYFPQLKKF